MSNRQENIELLTALVDGEIDDTVKSKELKELIDADEEIRFEYQIQSLMKKLVREKVEFQKAPEKLHKKIEKKIKPKSLRESGLSSIFPRIFGKPAFAFGVSFVIILALILLIFNRTPQLEYKDFAIEQNGSDNMFVQAKNNFRNILEGKLKPQIVTSNPEEIKNFFNKEGVHYKTIVPQYSNWQLLGAVVSEDDGEKFAHHVYTGNDGKLVYLFQVNEKYINNFHILNLTDDLLNYLDQGNCYLSKSENSTILMTKAKDNIIAVVSNIPPNALKQQFCGIN